MRMTRFTGTPEMKARFIHRQTNANVMRFTTVELSDIESRIAGLGFEKLDDGRRRLVVGGGEARVDLETGSGSVSVTRR